MKPSPIMALVPGQTWPLAMDRIECTVATVTPILTIDWVTGTVEIAGVDERPHRINVCEFGRVELVGNV